jgi:hypothetical protein
MKYNKYYERNNKNIMKKIETVDGQLKGAAFNCPMEPMGVEPVLLTCEASVLPIGLRPQQRKLLCKVFLIG